jgi:amino acid adenylation domain-containing protein
MARESQTSWARETADPVASMTSMSTDDPARLVQLRRALLEQRVRAAGSGPATEPAAVSPPTVSGPMPLSASQSQLWYQSQLAPDSRVLNEVIEIRKTGALDVDALRRALSKVVARHEVLRTTFDLVDGVPHQIIWEPKEVDLPLSDLSDLGWQESVERAVEIVAADSLRAYDLANGPLIRPRLIRIAENDHRLYIGLHHLIWDGLTLNRVVFPELVALYRSYVMGVPSSLPEPEAQYADYTKWELDWVRGPEIAKRIARWRNRLADITTTQLPLDHPRPSHQTFAGGTIPLTIDHTTVERLRSAARAAGGTLFHALAAAYAWWLHLYSESTEVVFGTPHDLRQRSDLFSVAGYAVTPVVVRCDVSGEESFIALMGRVGRVVTEALSDAVPFENLVSGLGVARDVRSNPLFQTSLVLEPPLTSPADDWSLHLMETDVRDALGSSKFDISIELDERPEGYVAGRLFFSTDLFDRETAREMMLHWCRLLEFVAAAPELPMGQHDLVTPDERGRQLSWNPTAQEGISPQSQCVHEIISEQVERNPDAVAVEVGDTTLTYRQLDDRAAAIASRLADAGVGTGSVVAVLLDRTPDLVATLLGILKSGAAFLPLDPRQPAARNSYSVNDAGASMIVTDRRLPANWDAGAATVIELGEPWSPEACHVAVSPSDLAYVIYTSGSTGRPKGVLLEHGGVTNLMRTMFRDMRVGACDTVLSVVSISFDVALGDIFCALACGARLVLATAAQATEPAALSQLIADSGATYMMATPTTWAALVASGWRGNRSLTAASIGETLPDGLARALLQGCGPVWNTYGPTEATIITTVEQLAEGDTVTVGKPLSDVRVYVIDPDGRLLPVGVPGEIAIGGVAVANGYHNRPEEQTRRFGNDPFHVGGRMYRTGDRGRFLPDGRLQHLGRFDDQLKIRGFRIEPGEIESTLCEHPEVRSCAVVASEARSGEKQLVAYIVGEPGRPSESEIRDWLRRRLPEHMIPSSFTHISALPTTASGKLDKAALPAPSPRVTGRTGAQLPSDDTERRVAALWAELVAVPVTDVNADFFDIGGHSLLAARMIFKVQREFDVAPSLAAFLDSGRTVAGLAALINTENVSSTDEVTSDPPLHFIFADLASAVSVRHFKDQWADEQPVHVLIPEQPGGEFDPSVTIEQHASRALSAICDRQPEGSLALAGYSIGGAVAYEIARQAVDAGRQVEWLGIIDCLAPSMAQLEREHQTLRWRFRKIRRRPVREQWAKYLEVGLRLLRSGVLWPQRDFDYLGAAEIACRYQLPGHDVPMQLFASEDTAADADTDLLGWDEFHKGPLEVHSIGSNHVSMLELPEVKQLAGMMPESLSKARASTRVGRPVAPLLGQGAK